MNNENINMILMKEEMKSKTVAWLLAYFLGFFGAHCFYIGRNKLAWAILLTFCSFILSPIAIILFLYSLFQVNSEISMHNRRVLMKYKNKD
jgi:TM2 domain-containing membrane protein YozV